MDVLVEVLTDDELARVRNAFAILVDASLRLSPAEEWLLAHADRSTRTVSRVAAQERGQQ